jgi:protein HIRA/HIR1
MRDSDSEEEEEEVTEELWKSRDEALLYEDEDGFENDLRLMEGLFSNESMRYKKVLACLDTHTSPVNCVRWNNIGTVFASAADDGNIILWEYSGEIVQSGLNKIQIYDTMAPRPGYNQEEGKVGGDDIMEEWRNKKTWTVHKRGVSDLAWAPDNIHFASCGTDSQVVIYSINETAPIKIIDIKANGITFDPFGKFMATQSSEDKILNIWRVQSNFKQITLEKSHSAYYKQSMSMSMFRRLSWSADGAYLSTTAGKIGAYHTAPLIERSSWKILGTLSGHSKTITTSRINSRLYRQDGMDALECYSVVAIASIDGTITVWKPCMEHPLTIVMDLFKTGISDLSWGFNGNVLLASSHDGQVAVVHYQPGILGKPLSEFEKQLIIEKRYGSSVLQEYKANHAVQVCLPSELLSNMGGAATNQQMNLTVDQLKEQ